MTDLLNDHGLEVIRKAGEPVQNGEAYNYQIRTSPQDNLRYNAIEVKKTVMTDAIIQIATPDGSGYFFIINKSENTVYIGDDAVTTSVGFPLEKNDTMELEEFKKSDGNEIYGRCDTGLTANVYAVASIKE